MKIYFTYYNVWCNGQELDPCSIMSWVQVMTCMIFEILSFIGPFHICIFLFVFLHYTWHLLSHDPITLHVHFNEDICMLWDPPSANTLFFLASSHHTHLIISSPNKDFVTYVHGWSKVYWFLHFLFCLLEEDLDSFAFVTTSCS